jgi:type I restriction enzyme M protein
MANNNHIIGKLWAACNTMMSDAGTTGALQYIQQFSWLLFLKVYEEIENNKRKEAAFEGKKYSDNIESPYKWSEWADKEKNLTGEELMKFVNDDLFPYLRNLRNKTNATKTQFVIAEIFRNSENLMKDGFYLREVIDKIGGIDFFSNEDAYAISTIYEGLFNKMKSSDIKPLAEFFTPRPITEFIAEMSDLKIGDTIYDPCNGPSGFLVAGYNELKDKVKSVKDYETLHEKTLYGKELKPLPFILGMMSMILNGIESPNIKQGNTLSTSLFSITEADRYSIVLTNPPFKGTAIGVSSNFPYPSKNTAILFLQHCMKSMKSKGRCAIIFPDGVLFKVDESPYFNTKKDLIENYNLHTIIRLPKGAFAPYTPIPTNILFFEKNGTTKNIWYYEMLPPKGKKNFTKSNPITIDSFEDCKKLFKSKSETQQSWNVDVETIIERNYNLDIQNPNSKDAIENLSTKKLIQLIEEKDNLSNTIINSIKNSIL